MEIKTRVPGMIEEIKVKVGDQVKMKDPLVVMEAMKMEQTIPSPVDGEVVEIKVEVGDRIRAGAVLVIIES